MTTKTRTTFCASPPTGWWRWRTWGQAKTSITRAGCSRWTLGTPNGSLTSAGLWIPWPSLPTMSVSSTATKQEGQINLLICSYLVKAFFVCVCVCIHSSVRLCECGFLFLFFVFCLFFCCCFVCFFDARRSTRKYFVRYHLSHIVSEWDTARYKY